MNKKELIKYFEDLPYVSITQMGKKSFIDLIEQLEEPQKVVVPQFIADWIETAKNIYSFSGGMFHGGSVVNKWLDDEDNQRTFALAWFDGYTIEEKRYMVKVKNISDRYGTLNRNKRTKRFILSNPEENSLYDTKFTRKEIEDAGFGEVFNSPLFEVVEVEE
jgi:hypothetical protein|nr:MAG TPA: Protein of unknown function (DUF1642) [Caudoviricetes sp.]